MICLFFILFVLWFIALGISYVITLFMAIDERRKDWSTGEYSETFNEAWARCRLPFVFVLVLPIKIPVAIFKYLRNGLWRDIKGVIKDAKEML